MTSSSIPQPQFPPKAEFRKWLRSLPPEEVVAERWDARSCPIANWLLKSKLAPNPYVRPDEIAEESAWRPDYGPVEPLPIWANCFARSIDNLGRERRLSMASYGYGYGPVTASDCLAVLRRTPRE